jgi:hypothetical protein
MTTPQGDTSPGTGAERPGILWTVYNNAVGNIIYFALGAAVTVWISGYYRWVALVLASIEALCALVQSLKLLLCLLVDCLMLARVVPTPPNITEVRWATLVRVGELVIWYACLYWVYRSLF